MIDAGRMIRKLRKERGMTQDALANLMHTTKQCISYYESGKRKVGLETLEELADIFNVPTAMFVSKRILDEEYRKEYSKPEYQVAANRVIDAGSSTQDLAPTTEAEQNMLRMFRAMSPEAQQTISAMMQTIINIQTASSGDDLNIDIKQNIIPNNTRKESAHG